MRKLLSWATVALTLNPPATPSASRYNTSGMMVPRTALSKYYAPSRSKYSPKACARRKR